MRLSVLAALAFVTLAACTHTDARSPAETAGAHGVRWDNGQWFDGRGFTQQTVYTVGGVLTRAEPAHVDETVDLGQRYVVPPFGDAHHHGIDAPDGLDLKIQAFLRAGIFYVKNPNVIPDLLTPEVRAAINKPSSIDVVFSNGGLTRTGGHPAPLHAMLAAKGVFKGLRPEDMENRAYFFIDSAADLDARWPRIRAGKPDFIKTFLGFSGEADAPPAMRGLDPAVLPAIVARAHGDGLRVTSHVVTVADFRVAVEAGVDELNHLPMYLRGVCDTDPSPCVVGEPLAREAAARGTFVVAAPVAWHDEWGAIPAEALARIRGVQQANLKRLLDAGVRVALGSDGISGEKTFATARADALYLDEHHLVDRLTLLRMWTETTAATIFPRRKLGRLDDGFEASFLVLEGNPLDDFRSVERIFLRVKEGQRLSLPQ